VVSLSFLTHLFPFLHPLLTFWFQLLLYSLHPDLSGNETIAKSLDAQRVQRGCQESHKQKMCFSILRRCLTIPLFTRKPYLSCCGKRGNEKDKQKIVFNRIGAGSISSWLLWHSFLALSTLSFGLWGEWIPPDRFWKQEVGKRFANEKAEMEGRGEKGEVVGEVYLRPVMISIKPKLTWQPARSHEICGCHCENKLERHNSEDPEPQKTDR
jgi:hypothetical protein